VGAKDFVEKCRIITSADVNDYPPIKFKPAEQWTIFTRSAEAVDVDVARWGLRSRFFSCYASSCTILAILRSGDGKCFLAHVAGTTDPLAVGRPKLDKTEADNLAKAMRKYLDTGITSNTYTIAMFTQGEGQYFSGRLWEKNSVRTIHRAIGQLTMDNTISVAGNTTIVTGHNEKKWTVTSSGVAIGPAAIYCFVGDESTPLRFEGQSEETNFGRNRNLYSNRADVQRLALPEIG